MLFRIHVFWIPYSLITNGRQPVTPQSYQSYALKALLKFLYIICRIVLAFLLPLAGVLLKDRQIDSVNNVVWFHHYTKKKNVI